MTKRSIVVAFTIAGVLGAASAASAECAWVLYFKRAVRPDPKAEATVWKWEVLSAHPNYAACRNSMASKELSYGRDGLAFGQECLPDTIDPRRPKGG